jgi:hypothetical protein
MRTDLGYGLWTVEKVSAGRLCPSVAAMPQQRCTAHAATAADSF